LEVSIKELLSPKLFTAEAYPFLQGNLMLVDNVFNAFILDKVFGNHVDISTLIHVTTHAT